MEISKINHYINGKSCQKDGESYLPVFCSYNGEQVAEVAIASHNSVDEAVQAAKKAFAIWKDVPPSRRAQRFISLHALVLENLSKLAETLAVEHGKVFQDGVGEVMRGIEVIDFVIGAPHLLKGGYSARVATNVDAYEITEPLGVCVGITPFNFPSMVPLWMFPVAIAAGNTFILKPSEQDPSCGLILAELMQQAGFPDGVFNVVNGDKSTVDLLLNHTDVAAISFVGSTPVAKSIYNKGTAAGKKVQALGGAKNHLIVMPDANIESVTNALMGAAYGSAGERCMAISVAVTVGEKVADQLIPSLATAIAELKIGAGNGKDNQMDMGPLISQNHLNRVRNYIEIGINEGAKLVCDGRNYINNEYIKGFFIGATLFDHVSPDMTIYKDEIFGPILCVVRVANLEQAIQLINNNQYANGTAIFTNDGFATNMFVKKINVGMIGINVAIPVPVAYYSFGGWKSSKFGGSNVYGVQGLDFYTQTKTITSRWQVDTELSHFYFPRNSS